MGNSLIETALKLQNNVIDRFAPLSGALVDMEAMPWIKGLEAELATIQAELAQLIRTQAALPPMSSLSDRQEGMGGAGWQSFVFRMYGNEVPTAAPLCPKTFDLVNNIKGVDTAMFSVLQPGAEIEAHCGPSKAELRYHLPLVVPTSDPEVCGLRVGDEVLGWEVGRGLLFDDTVDHEAWNRADSYRVVLFIGCRRPMPSPLAQFIDVLTSYATKGHPDVNEILEKSATDHRRIVSHLLKQFSSDDVIDLREQPNRRPMQGATSHL